MDLPGARCRSGADPVPLSVRSAQRWEGPRGRRPMHQRCPRRRLPFPRPSKSGVASLASWRARVWPSSGSGASGRPLGSHIRARCGSPLRAAPRALPGQPRPAPRPRSTTTEILHASVLVHSYAVAEAAAGERLGVDPRALGPVEEWGTELLSRGGSGWDDVKDGRAGVVEVAVVRNAVAHGRHVVDERSAQRLVAAGVAHRPARLGGHARVRGAPDLSSAAAQPAAGQPPGPQLSVAPQTSEAEPRSTRRLRGLGRPQPVEDAAVLGEHDHRRAGALDPRLDAQQPLRQLRRPGRRGRRGRRPAPRGPAGRSPARRRGRDRRCRRHRARRRARASSGVRCGSRCSPRPSSPGRGWGARSGAGASMLRVITSSGLLWCCWRPGSGAEAAATRGRGRRTAVLPGRGAPALAAIAA